MSPTLQPSGVILLSANDVTASKTAEECRVPAHKVRCDASVQFAICSKKYIDSKKQSTWGQKVFKKKGEAKFFEIPYISYECFILAVRINVALS